MFSFNILRPFNAYSTYFSPRFYSHLVGGNVGSIVSSFFIINKIGLQNMQVVRFMNRNARRPKKANHGKRPCSHARRWEKRGKLRSIAYKEKLFGFW